MKRNWKEILLWGIVLVVIIPLIIACLFNIPLIKTATQNEWIGFWGGYLGALFGGFITLYVMRKTNEVSREHLELSLDNEKQLEKRKEKLDFCNYVIKKLSLIVENIEETSYKAHDCKIDDDSNIVEKIQIYSKQLRMTRSMVLELYMHFEIKKTQQEYIPERAKEIAGYLNELHEELEVYYETFLKDEECDKIESKLWGMINDIGPKINCYVKDLLVSNK